MKTRRSAFRLPLAAAMAALLLGGCLKTGSGSGGSFAGRSLKAQSAAVDVDRLGTEYERSPTDRKKALAYAAALRALGRTVQALAVLEASAVANPGDREVLSAYGKILVDAGRSSQAEEVLSRAHSPERPDWSILSAQGIAADQLGDHERARELYRAALTIAPDEPSVLSNLGLSHALSGRLAEAEDVLRRAAAQPGAEGGVRRNLALVLALAGKTSEARDAAATEMSPEEASAFVSSIRPRPEGRGAAPVASTRPRRTLSTVAASE
jgi:Flp pilus assembly protein TadD